LRSGLSNNAFNGVLPDFLGTLPQLTALQLATNYFTGVCVRARVSAATLRALCVQVRACSALLDAAPARPRCDRHGAGDAGGSR
jgi:hypothetical protein